jgi:hypothetical protein
LCAPQPVFYKSKQIRDAPEPTAALSCIFMFVNMSNREGITYTLDEKAEEAFCRYFDEFRDFVERSYRVDPFIRYIIDFIVNFIKIICFIKYKCCMWENAYSAFATLCYSAKSS